MEISDKGLRLLVMLEAVSEFIWRNKGVGCGRESHARPAGGRGGAGVRVRGGEGGRELLVTIVLNLSLDQLVPCPQELMVLGEVVSLCSCALVLLLGVPVG